MPVAFTNVKDWRVDEPVSNRLDRDERPPVAVSVVPIATDPVKLADDEIV